MRSSRATTARLRHGVRLWIRSCRCARAHDLAVWLSSATTPRQAAGALVFSLYTSKSGDHSARAMIDRGKWVGHG